MLAPALTLKRSWQYAKSDVLSTGRVTFWLHALFLCLIGLRLCPSAYALGMDVKAVQLRLIGYRHIIFLGYMLFYVQTRKE